MYFEGFQLFIGSRLDLVPFIGMSVHLVINGALGRLQFLCKLMSRTCLHLEGWDSMIKRSCLKVNLNKIKAKEGLRLFFFKNVLPQTNCTIISVSLNWAILLRCSFKVKSNLCRLHYAIRNN